MTHASPWEMWPQLYYHLRELSNSNYNRSNNDITIYWKYTMSQIIWWTLITAPEDTRIISSLDHMSTLCWRSKTRLGCPSLSSPYPFSQEREWGWGRMPGLHSFLFSFCPKIWLSNLLFIFIIFFLYNSQSISQKLTSSTPKVKLQERN